MKVWKFKKRIEIDKTMGNFHISTFHYGSYENDKPKHWTELHCWCEPDCENCVSAWEDRGYEGECYDCGCCLAKKGCEEAPIWICMLPNWVKKIFVSK